LTIHWIAGVYMLGLYFFSCFVTSGMMFFGTHGRLACYLMTAGALPLMLRGYHMSIVPLLVKLPSILHCCAANLILEALMSHME
jgi:hypothetical protein